MYVHTIPTLVVWVWGIRFLIRLPLLGLHVCACICVSTALSGFHSMATCTVYILVNNIPYTYLWQALSCLQTYIVIIRVKLSTMYIVYNIL